jgi:hypothetical protein
MHGQLEEIPVLSAMILASKLAWHLMMVIWVMVSKA